MEKPVYLSKPTESVFEDVEVAPLLRSLLTEMCIRDRVKAVQWILTHSFYAKALAIKQVTSNKGSDTAGVDGVTWSTHL